MLLFLAGVDASGQLSWNKTQERVILNKEQDTLTVRFSFQNKGTQPVTIAPVRSCCGAIVKELGKSVFQPGESGVVVVDLDLRKNLRKIIHVRTLAPEPKTDTLSIQIEMPRSIRFAPELLYWSATEAKTRKSAVAELSQTLTAKFLRVECAEPGFKAEAKELSKTRFELFVTPPDILPQNVWCDAALVFDVDGKEWRKTIPVRCFTTRTSPTTKTDTGRRQTQ